MTTARNYWVIWWYCWLVEMMPQLLVKLGSLNMMCLSALPHCYPCAASLDSQS